MADIGSLEYLPDLNNAPVTVSSSDYTDLKKGLKRAQDDIAEVQIEYRRIINELQTTKQNLIDEVRVAKKDFIDGKEHFANISQITVAIVGGVLVAFTVALAAISADYSHNNEARYEKFLDQIEEIKDSVYSKSEVDSLFKSFKECVWFNGLSHCLR